MSNHMSNTPTDDSLNLPLMKTLRFDADDLTLNRVHALLSTRQRHRIAFEIYGYLSITLIALVGVGGFLFVQVPSLALLVLSAVLIGVLISIVIAGNHLRLNRHSFNQRLVLSVRGPIERTINKSGRIVTYHICIDDKRFQVQPDVFAAFEDGQNYRLYFMPSGRLLSAEHDPFRKSMPQ